MESDDLKNILVVDVDTPLYAKISPVLERSCFEVDRFPDPGRAVELLSVVPFSALIIGFPLHGMELGDFLAGVRKGRSAWAATALLSTQEHRQAAEAFTNQGVQMVLSVEKAAQEMQRLLCALLGVSPRAAVRVMVRMEVALNGGPHDRFLAQTEDLSETGMLVITDKLHPVGRAAGFSLTLPIDPTPIQGVAEVARHTEVGRDRVQGMGFKFLGFSGDGRERLCDYLEAVIPRGG